MYIEKLASAIKNDVVSGLRGYHQNLSLNIEQLLDEIIACRLAIIKEWVLKGLFPIKDLLVSINCVDVDCESLERCRCKLSHIDDDTVMHFEIPLIITDLGKQAIEYIGSVDRLNKFTVVTSLTELNTKKYRKRGKNKPYVWIDYAPNQNGMLDCFVFNAPFLRQVSVVAAIKDPRQLKKYNCCGEDYDNLTGPDDNMSYLSQLIKDKLVKEKIYYYRQLQPLRLPNDQQYVTGG